MSLIMASIKVSFLAMGVIFIVLGILIGVVKVLVHFLPYKAPPVRPPRAKAPAVSSQDEDHIAAIHAALAHHLGQAPQNIHLVDITAQ